MHCSYLKTLCLQTRKPIYIYMNTVNFMQTCMPTLHMVRTKNMARQTFQVPVYHKTKIPVPVCVARSTAWARHHLLISHACNIGEWLIYALHICFSHFAVRISITSQQFFIRRLAIVVQKVGTRQTDFCRVQSCC